MKILSNNLKMLGEQMPEVVKGIVQDCGQGFHKPLEPEVSEWGFYHSEKEDNRAGQGRATLK